MDYIQANKVHMEVVGIPESKSGHVVIYQVFKASDNSVFASGTAIYVGGFNWKISFTPTVLDVYAIDVYNQDLDVTYSRSVQAVSSVTLSQPVEDEETPTASELIDLIDKAIATRLRGGAVLSYSIGGRNLQYLTLSELRNLRADLGKQIAAQNGGGRNYAKFVNPD
ncbi:MAG: hypothetical protein Q7K71_05440 [Candidatus Omnitrophota bacterium]|nr:hypothetical protein [Candidatus Omnitrophota bacterium]